MSLTVFCAIVLLSAHFGDADDKTECGPPPLVEGTVLDVEDTGTYPLGASVEYTCDFGFFLSGNPKTVACVYDNETDSGKWTEPNFRCVARACGEPGFVSHARRNGALFTFPNKVTYICDTGYRLQGSSQRFCQANGQWSGRLPSCQRIKCEAPSNPENGHVTYESLQYESKLQYVCNKGYILDTTEERKCLETGLWSGKEPACLEAHCNYPIAPLHGTMEMVGGKPTVGSIALFECNEGYKLQGSSTSKCLSTGDWSFEPPICLDTCTVPKVNNGWMGVYEKSRFRTTFRQLKEDTVVDHGQEVHLRCFTKYEPPGGGKDEVKITCLNGKWSLEPACKPASCQSNPPSVPNANLITTERDHGTVLTYICKTNFVKTTTGSVRCLAGSWTGKRPVCTDTRCSLSILNFQGLDRSGKQKYGHNEEFSPKCLEGYELSKPGSSALKCVRKEWIGHVPPCKPAKCSQPPEAPKNGRIVEYASHHGSTATVVCNTWYQLSPNAASITCSYGKWNSVEDACVDTRCYPKDLKNYDGVKVLTNQPTLSGDYEHIACLEGYVPVSEKLKCSDGVWRLMNNYSPCRPGSCRTQYVQHGEFVYAKTYSKYSWSKVRFETVTDYIQLTNGVSYKHDSVLHFRCIRPYVFQGIHNAYIVKIQCTKQKWVPTPMCLAPGYPMPVETTTIKPHTTSLLSTYVNKVTTAASSTFSSSSASKDEDKLESEEMVAFTDDSFEQDITLTSTSVENVLDNTEKNCTCIYSLDDDNVTAFAGTELLKFNSEVQKGSSVQFSCRYVGHDHLIGPSSLECENCSWHSSQFPICAKPKQGDAILDVKSTENNLITVSPAGVLAVPKGLNLNITCYIKDVQEWPSFGNLPKYIETKYTDQKVQGKHLLIAYLEIRHINSSFNGRYECVSHIGKSSHIELEVPGGAHCPDIVSNTLRITYSSKQEVNSKVSFECLDENRVLVGEHEAVCLSTGEWSSEPPLCQSAGCPALVVPEGMNVFYKENRQVNSQAVFSCVKPYALDGSPVVTCLANGQWSGKLPVCNAVFCSMQSLMELVPENVVPKPEGVTGPEMPYGSVLPLECAIDTLRLIGPRNATCTKQGSWQLGNVACASGCAALELEENAELIIEPLKDFYRFGEFITFSCPPGFKLSSDVERIMCLRNGWSDDPTPACKAI